MGDIPQRVSEEQLPWVQVTPYHRHNSVNLPRHLLHSTLHLFLAGDGLGHLYIHYTTMVTTASLVYTLIKKIYVKKKTQRNRTAG